MYYNRQNSRARQIRRQSISQRGNYPQLNGTFIQFLEWAKSDEFWSVLKKDERQRAAEIKAEMLKEQKEIIRLIKECEHRAEEELQIALTVLNNIETKL
jgi:hypothetical protein